MSRDNDCVETLHTHVGVCMRAGYANGRADVLDEVEEAVAEAAHALLESDALTANHDGTPEHYIVEVENVEYLVGIVLAAASSAVRA